MSRCQTLLRTRHTLVTHDPLASGIRTTRLLARLAGRTCPGVRHQGGPARLYARLVASLQVERDGAVLRVTLARAERRNAFDSQLIAELAEAFVDVGKARAVVLAGAGA